MKVQAFVADGSLISIDQRQVVEKEVGRNLDWKEVPETRQEAGFFFQAQYEAEVSEEEAKSIEAAIDKYREEIGDYR